MSIFNWVSKLVRYTLPIASILLLALAAWCLNRAYNNEANTALGFDTSKTTGMNVILSLAAIAAIVERATEVVVMVFRDHQADLNDANEDLTKAALTKAPFDPKAAEAAATASRMTLGYQAETKEFALQVAFVFGLAAALAGVRALEPLLLHIGTSPRPVGIGRLFTTLDIFITGAMLAGGSEGIHRLANVFTSGADGLSTKFDKSAAK